jgi:hypothetical protein
VSTQHVDRFTLFKDLGYEPHAGQLEIHKSRASRRIVACGVRWGKTRAAAMEGLAAALEPRERSIGWVVAPTYDLADRVFREIQVIALEKLRHRVIAMKEHERRLILRNMGGGTSEIRGKTADNPVSLLGEGLDWLIVDEAARLKPDIWQSHLSQRLLDKNGWALLISTPKGKGYFHGLFLRGRGQDPDYQSWNWPSESNPYLDLALIEAERRRLPTRVFDQEYGAQFCEGAGAVFRNVRDCATGDFTSDPVRRDDFYYGGLDLAKIEDYTVITIVDERGKVVYFDRFHRIDWSLQVERVKEASARFNDATMMVDSTGYGEPVFEAVRRAGCSARAYTLTQKSKTDLINHLALLLEQRAIVLPRPEIAPVMIEELEAFEYSTTDNGGMRSGAPSGMHDDCVISLALAAWRFHPESREPRINCAWG